MADRNRIVLEPMEVVEVSHRATIGGGLFVTGSGEISDVPLFCWNCGGVAITVPKTAIHPEPSEKLVFRCDSCGKYGGVPPGAGNAIE